ncbi:helix-turn-helix domain-containing protein [Streptomyces sp. KAU_LT]|uniref:PucR family transcriptional regulator n=1 Tax=Streptomyces sp. KAU_LT TaxID=3046669 RepID=UPI0024B84773|nr:helix-turn-helix domain-containing protein [Streptomyces sp. KAU_LT]MDI9830662.1 helix-turn-helix domain-containing protein [Streptomyces sp. KAU_LT]
MHPPADREEISRRAAARVAGIAAATSGQLDDVARVLQVELAESIPELRGDRLMLDLLHASVESNVKTFFHVARYGLPVDTVEAPWPAVEYARRLAQREISSNALLRAYRLGHRRALEWVAGELARVEPDGLVSFAALQMLQESAFAYIDRVSEQVVAEYETARERWLAHRNTIRTATLSALLAGDEVDVSTAEQVLGYRLRQQHLGLVLWADERMASARPLGRLGQLTHAMAQEMGAESPPLFVPQDRSLGWGWVPLRAGTRVDLDRLARCLGEAGPEVRAAIGAVGTGPEGFRATHRQALQAHQVAVVGADRARRITSYTAPGVRAAAILAGDLTTARDLVTSMLGGLARDDEGTERLRETLAVFLQENQSFVATAAKVHLHKNTVKYRVDKAVRLRGRPIDEDRLDLELALAACRWLGPAVLPPSP